MTRRNAPPNDLVLVGAGPTGVELAASIAQLVSVTLRQQFPQIEPVKSRILLLDGGAPYSSTFAESLSRKAAKRLTKLGVESFDGGKVEKVDDQGVIRGGRPDSQRPPCFGGRR